MEAIRLELSMNCDGIAEPASKAALRATNENKAAEKSLRRITFHLKGLFSRKSWLVTKSIEDYKVPNALARELVLSGNRRLLLTDSGLEHFKIIASELHAGDLFNGLAHYGDIRAAARRVLRNLLSDGLQPEDGDEFIGLVSTEVNANIAIHTFVVPIYGLHLEAIDRLKLGEYEVARPDGDLVAQICTLKGKDREHLSKAMNAMSPYLWLIGSAKGTPDVAKTNFSSNAELIVGLLAVLSATTYEGGATGFRIGVIMAPERAYGRSVWMSTTDSNRRLTIHSQFAKTQALKLDVEAVASEGALGMVAHGFELVSRPAKNTIEDALIRAVLWFSDAQRDTVPTMQLVKYWSCVECFFNADDGRVVEPVVTGLVTTLVFGGYRFIPCDEYRKTWKRAEALYELRSTAVHQARHKHVLTKDVQDISQWVAWMIVTVIAITQRNELDTVEKLRAAAARADQMVRGAAGGGSSK